MVSLCSLCFQQVTSYGEQNKQICHNTWLRLKSGQANSLYLKVPPGAPLKVAWQFCVALYSVCVLIAEIRLIQTVTLNILNISYNFNHSKVTFCFMRKAVTLWTFSLPVQHLSSKRNILQYPFLNFRQHGAFSSDRKVRYWTVAEFTINENRIWCAYSYSLNGHWNWEKLSQKCYCSLSFNQLNCHDRTFS